MATFVLDTSAVLAIANAEAGAEAARDLLQRARTEPETRILMPFVGLTEFEHKLIRTIPENEIEDQLGLIAEWPVETMESTSIWGRAAADVKGHYRLSFADAWVAALALLHDATLVHKDPEFDSVPTLKHLRLPCTPPPATTRRSRS